LTLVARRVTIFMSNSIQAYRLNGTVRAGSLFFVGCGIMAESKVYLAVDIGASSGRLLAG